MHTAIFELDESGLDPRQHTRFWVSITNGVPSLSRTQPRWGRYCLGHVNPG